MQDTEAEEWCQDQVWKSVLPSSRYFKSTFLIIPPIFLEYLSLDSVIVDLNDSEDEVQHILHSQEMSNFMHEISEKIQLIGGNGVVPRLNWSCPK